jgi:hypothetical protein
MLATNWSFGFIYFCYLINRVLYHFRLNSLIIFKLSCIQFFYVLYKIFLSFYSNFYQKISVHHDGIYNILRGRLAFIYILFIRNIYLYTNPSNLTWLAIYILFTINCAPEKLLSWSISYNNNFDWLKI